MNRKSLDQEKEIAGMLLMGFGLRETAEVLHCSPNTVKRIKDYIAVDKCRCGAIWGHRGWCKARFAVRPNRRHFWGVMVALQQLARSGEIIRENGMYRANPKFAATEAEMRRMYPERFK